jgi:hypothetical protein
MEQNFLFNVLAHLQHFANSMKALYSKDQEGVLNDREMGHIGAGVLFSASMIPLPENYTNHSLVLPFLYALAWKRPSVLIFVARGKDAKPPSYGEMVLH